MLHCRVCHENLDNLEDLKRCSCKKLAKARFEYYADGKTGNKNENPNGFQFPPQPRHSAGALRKRKGRAEGEDEAERQETAKVSNTTYRYIDKDIAIHCPSN